MLEQIIFYYFSMIMDKEVCWIVVLLYRCYEDALSCFLFKRVGQKLGRNIVNVYCSYCIM